MYDLPYHKEKKDQVIREFIEEHPFAFLSGCDSEGKPVATQIPVFFEIKEGKKILRGHIMKNTDHHKAFLQNGNVLAVFTGSSAYVSATWYSNPHQASTWNYMSVHAKGLIRFLDNDALVDVLQKTSLHFENYNQESPTVYNNLPAAYTGKLMNAIAVFEIEVLEMNTVFKLSQDRDAASYENIIFQLMKRGHEAQAIALEMEKRKAELYPGNNT
jgi:transcriptional regulator